MQRRVLAPLAAFLVLLISSPSSIFAQNCNRDCNSDCCHKVPGPPLIGDKTVCDPACKVSCEASKKVCQNTGISPPVLPSAVGQVAAALQRSCAAGFEVVTKAVIQSQGFYAAGSDYMINEAKAVLSQRTNLFQPGEFNGVTIRWCRLSSGTDGMTPDRDYICLSDDLLNTANHFKTAVILAHEMIHVRQYRQLGTDQFKCQYSQQFVNCKGCQDDSHPLEHEAYEFEKNVATPRITQVFNGGGQQQPSGAFCNTPLGRFGPGPVRPIGSVCTVQMPSGPLNGSIVQ